MMTIIVEEDLILEIVVPGEVQVAMIDVVQGDSGMIHTVALREEEGTALLIDSATIMTREEEEDVDDIIPPIDSGMIMTLGEEESLQIEITIGEGVGVVPEVLFVEGIVVEKILGIVEIVVETSMTTALGILMIGIRVEIAELPFALMIGGMVEGKIVKILLLCLLI